MLERVNIKQKQILQPLDQEKQRKTHRDNINISYKGHTYTLQLLELQSASKHLCQTFYLSGKKSVKESNQIKPSLYRVHR